MLELSWNSVFASGDAETIWNALYLLVREACGRPLPAGLAERQGDPCSQEPESDIAQEVFLLLLSTGRLSYFASCTLTSEQIESDIILNEMTAVLLSRSSRPKSEDRSSSSERPPSPATSTGRTFRIAQTTKRA